MSDLDDYLQAHKEGHEVRVPLGAGLEAELEDLRRRHAALTRAVQLREKSGIGPTSVGWSNDPASFQVYDTDANELKSIEGLIDARVALLSRRGSTD